MEYDFACPTSISIRLCNLPPSLQLPIPSLPNHCTARAPQISRLSPNSSFKNNQSAPQKLIHHLKNSLETMEIDREIEMDRRPDEPDFNDDDEEHDEETQLLKDRFRLSAISIAESEAKNNGMQVSPPIVACISNLAFNYAEHLAKDLELFAHHAGRKLVNTEDVILAAHRNESLSLSLRAFCEDLKAKGPPSERKRKKPPRKEDRATTSALETSDM